MNRFVLRFCLLAALALGLLHSSAWGQSRATGEGFDLTATDGIRFLAAEGRYEATGNVQLVVGDWIVLADRVVATLDADQQKMERLSATGKVFLQRENLKARVSDLTLKLNPQKLTLRGAPINMQMGEDRLVSEGTLSFDLESGSMSLEQAFVLQAAGAVISGGAATVTMASGVVQELRVRDGADVEQGDFRAAAQSLRYDREAGEVFLDGAVVLQSGGVLLSGASAMFDLTSGALQLNNDSDQRISGALRSQ